LKAAIGKKTAYGSPYADQNNTWAVHPYRNQIYAHKRHMCR